NSSTGVRYAVGRTPIHIADRDIDGVTIVIASADIKGRVIRKGTPPPAPPGAPLPRISLVPRDNTPAFLLNRNNIGQTLDSSGEFSFPDVPPGKYSFQLLPIPAGLYIADIRVGQKSVYDEGIISVGAIPLESLEIVLSEGGGTIQGFLEGS